MLQRSIGELKASVIGLGTWAIGGWMWGGSEEEDSVRTIHAALDNGINLIDTAPVYGMGFSEEIVGKALKGRRDQAIIATKCGLVWDCRKGEHFFDTGLDNVKEGGDYKVYKYLGPESIRVEVERSLRRLQTDHIDLYQTHWQEATTPIAETMQVLLDLKKEGKIRAIGCSNATPAQMAKYADVGRLDSDQEKYNMLDRDHEETNLPYCKQYDVAFLSYSSMCKGLLSGKMGPERKFNKGDQRLNDPRFSEENRRYIQTMLGEFQVIAEKHSLTTAQLVTAWTYNQPGCTHTLVGARTPEQVMENADCGEVNLSDEDNRFIRKVLAEYEK